MTPPDYHSRSIVNLMASLTSALGGDEGIYAPLTALPSERLACTRNVVLLVLDGLGYHWLRERAASNLAQCCVGAMNSVFPPTTASAITTFLTGEAPQQHGLTGWFVHFKELGGVAAVLPYQPRVTRKTSYADHGIEPAAFFGHTPLMDRLAVECHSVVPRWIADSPFNRAHQGRAKLHRFNSMGGFFREVTRAVRGGGGRKYVYGYWPEYDALAHEHGTQSRQVAEQFEALDRGFGALLKSLAGTDTVVIATADHGFIDTTRERVVHLADHPTLADCLALPLCGEPRAAYCYLHPGREKRFLDYVGEHFDHCCEAVASERLIDEGWFGLGEPHPRLWQRVGHYTLMMKENWVIKDQLAGEKAFHHVGVHGGTSEAEMTVPLIVATL
ncbi:alkaline phosphatase family protein [Endothiovibrio diazotrophicus]